MLPFRNPVDIANAALQHCGAERISDTLGFNEDSEGAAECSFRYDKVRRSELERNTWRFAIRYAVLRAIDANSRLLLPALWIETQTYYNGSIVSDAQNVLWISSVNQNTGNAPGNSGYWDLYFGPLAIPVWDADLAYYAGDVIYTTAGDGTFKVYLSLVNDNSDVPGTVTAYDATAQYKTDDIVTSAAVAYQSLIDFNLANLPSATTAPAVWAVGTTYGAAARVRGSDGLMYLSIAGGNLAHDPVADTSHTYWTATGVLASWTSVTTRPASANSWLRQSDVALRGMAPVNPIGVGATNQSTGKAVFRLPANYLKIAPDDPKQGSVSYLGAPSGRAYNDWIFHDQYIITRDASPLVLRFAGDMVDVTKFTTMFCEGLAARLGWEICPKITQSVSKRSDIAAAYTKFMTEARMKNAIEIGAVESAEDDWISTRL